MWRPISLEEKTKNSSTANKQRYNKLSSAQISLRSGKFELKLRTSSAQLGSSQRSSAFNRYLDLDRSLVFYSPMIQILELYLDFEGAKNIFVL